MPDILHRVGIKSSQDQVYQALSTREGLGGWWTSNTQGQSKVGGVLQFRFGAGGFDMKVLELHPTSRVLWQVVEGPPEWIGTTVSWELKQEGDYAIVLFKHRLERARGIHAPLQHQVGNLSDESQVAGGNRDGRPRPERRQDRQLELRITDHGV